MSQKLAPISLILSVCGLIFGLLIAFAVLSGDALGRVNLLYLLLLFAFLPLVTLLLTLVLLPISRGRGLAGQVLSLPVWPERWRRELLISFSGQEARSWFFLQSQILALSFAAGNLLAFFIMLLGTDVSFVWRSTLLQAPDLLPLLELISMPWQFWQPAQPSLELLSRTQDFRLQETALDAAISGLWWRYVLAAQCCYNLLPRSLMLLYAHYSHKRVKPEAPTGADSRQPLNRAPEGVALADIYSSLEPPYRILNWGRAPEPCMQFITAGLGRPDGIQEAGPEMEIEADEDEYRVTNVVLVKSWEPPMGELADFLSHGSGYVLPLDWNEKGQVQIIRASHQQEWQRFCSAIDGWKLLQVPT